MEGGKWSESLIAAAENSMRLVRSPPALKECNKEWSRKNVMEHSNWPNQLPAPTSNGFQIVEGNESESASLDLTANNVLFHQQIANSSDLQTTAPFLQLAPFNETADQQPRA